MEEFEAPAVGVARYVWDQLVHVWFGERCAFLVVTLPEIDGDTREKIEAVALRMGLTSTSAYVAYGYFDVLVRFWSTLDERERFVDELRRVLGKDADFELFDVVDIDYSRWSHRERVADPNAVVRSRREIVKLMEGEDPKGLLMSLSNAGLVHSYDPQRDIEGGLDRANSYYKVYLILRRTKVDAPELNAERLDRLEPVLGSLEFLAMPSVYYGSGRTIDCMIEGLVAPESIGEIYLWILDLKDRLIGADLALRPMTLILAKAGEVDRDQIRIDIEGPEDQDVRHLRSYLSEQANDEWQFVRSDLKGAIVQVFRDHWADAASGPFIRNFLDLIEGAILADPYRLNGAGTFIFDLENEVRSAIVKQLLPGILGRHEWRGTVLAFLKSEEDRFEAEAEVADDPEAATQSRAERMRVARLLETLRSRLDSMSLGESLYTLRRLVAGGVVPAEAVTAALGDRWFECYQPAVAFRNDYAHGRLYFSGNTVDAGWWTALATQVIEAGLLVGRLSSEDAK